LKSILARSALVLLVLGTVAGCPKKDEESEETATKTTDEKSKKGGDDEDETKGEGDTKPSSQPSSQPTLQPDTPPSSPGGGRAKSELDGKEPDGDFTGTSLTAGKAAFVGPKDWKKDSKEGFTVLTATDDKARFAAKSSSSPSSDLEAAAKALGLSDCKWGTAEAISLGKDKLAADVADGTCKRGAGEVQAVYAALSGEGTLAMGSWDSGGDDKSMFNAFRSATKVSGTGVDPIAACCAALAQNAASAPPQWKGAYITAAGACNAMRNNPQGRAALAGVRAALGGAAVPAPCR
jgi:hypothetical protein